MNKYLMIFYIDRAYTGAPSIWEHIFSEPLKGDNLK